jgi:hypothetical protein
VLFHLAPAADHEALLRLLDAVQRATGQLLLLQDGDSVARHLAVADQEGRARQCRQARADKPGRFVLHALGFARAGEGFVVATAMIHKKTTLLADTDNKHHHETNQHRQPPLHPGRTT